MLQTLSNWLWHPPGLTPHGFCLLWEPGQIWLHAASDAVIAVAYFSIPVALAAFASRRDDLLMRPVLWLFAAFIMLCGSGHLFDIVTLWIPAYWLEGFVKAATALVSISTAILLWGLIPQALALPSPAQLREANQALQESEALYRSWFEHSPTPVTTQDEHGIITGVSESWLTLLGYEKAEVLGRHLSDFRAPGFRVLTDGDWTTIVSGAELEQRLVRKDGEVVHALVKGRQVRRGNDTSVILVLTDISARRRAEEALHASEDRLRQAQKMEAIGQITGGVAHDFNNVLTAVIGSLDLIRRRLKDDKPEVARFADNALEADARAAGLTAQLLSFSRRQQLDSRPIDAADVVRSMLPLLERSIDPRITLTIEADPQAGLCLADRNQLESALLNLVLNARDAINAPGAITIVVQADRIDGNSEDEAAGIGPPAGAYVRVAVHDDGAGMPDDVRRRAFEPFFTTKPHGQGSGLGLSQIHGFAHQSGGTVTIDSTLGEGSAVAILLPSAGQDGRQSHTPAIPAITQAPHGRNERLLLVEDDALVRNAFGALLRELGYEVVEAVNGHAALPLLDDPATRAVLTDLTMPGNLDGLQLAKIVQQRRPGLPIMLLTGHLDPFRGGDVPSGVAVVQKPCDTTMVAVLLRKMLASGAELADAGAT